MTRFKFFAALALAVPAVALAQVGPNPAVNGSLDPTVGPTTDRATAPDDATPADSTPMTANSSAPATASDPAAAAGEAKRSTAPTSETVHKKPR